MSPTIQFTYKDTQIDQVCERSKRLKRVGPPLQLSEVQRSILFLRGVHSRATFCLPAFYYFLGAVSSKEEAEKTEDFPFVVAQSYAEFADLNIVSLSCRKIFDHAVNDALTGALFAKSSTHTLRQIAEHWSNRQPERQADALQALTFLKRMFQECSKSDSQLLSSDGLLQKRIGLIKQHADKAAAHLTVDYYEFDISDIAHVVAVITILGEIIREFDSPNTKPHYFNEIDRAAHVSAKHRFPLLGDYQLFSKWDLSRQAKMYYQCNIEEGVFMLMNEVHRAIG